MALENCRLNEILLLPSKEFSFQKMVDLYHFTASCETIAHLTFFCCVIKGFILVPVTLSYSRIDSESLKHPAKRRIGVTKSGSLFLAFDDFVRFEPSP
jgi:hypothetical protein